MSEDEMNRALADDLAHKAAVASAGGNGSTASVTSPGTPSVSAGVTSLQKEANDLAECSLKLARACVIRAARAVVADDLAQSASLHDLVEVAAKAADLASSADLLASTAGRHP